MKKTHDRWFTLIELLVVIAIIGILASIVLVALNSSRAKGRDARRIADIRTIQLALETYYSDNNHYPLSIYGNGGLSPTYLPVVPSDPGSSTACTTGAETTCYKYVPLGPGGDCKADASQILKYHVGSALEQQNTTAVQDANASPQTSGGFQACISSGKTDFYGASPDCSTSQPSSNIDTCYDVTN